MPFTMKLGRMGVTVAGSNGIDQSLKYDLALAVPRADLDAAAGRTVARLASQAGKAGIDLNAAEVVELSAQVTGTVTNPTIKPNFAGVASTARQAVEHAVEQQVETRVTGVRQR